MISFRLRSIDAATDDLAVLDARLDEMIQQAPGFSPAGDLLLTVPGLGRRGAEDLLAEIGPDLTIFESIEHLPLGVGVCPGSHESAGKKRNVATRPGERRRTWNPRLRSRFGWGLITDVQPPDLETRIGTGYQYLGADCYTPDAPPEGAPTQDRRLGSRRMHRHQDGRIATQAGPEPAVVGGFSSHTQPNWRIGAAFSALFGETQPERAE